MKIRGRGDSAAAAGTATPLPRRRGQVVLLTGLFAVMVAGAGGWWAAWTIMAPAPDVLQAPPYTLVSAQTGTVEQSVRLNTSAHWPSESTVANQAVGTVTEVPFTSGSRTGAGDVLYTVDLRPVVAAPGPVPAFRELRRGDEGADVAQLQRFLVELGHLAGEVDGEFGDGVHQAVRAWQRAHGLDDDGVVRRGDVLFVPRLPARLGLGEDVSVGSSLVGGEPAVRVLAAAPDFTIVLPEGQARLVGIGMRVEIGQAGDTPWQAEIVELRMDPERGTAAVLGGIGDSTICGEECDLVPVAEEVLLPSTIEVVPAASGITVPAAALVSTAGGEVLVVLEDGSTRSVEVVAAASGMAVVNGVAAGERVRAPGELSDTGGGTGNGGAW